MASPFSFHVGQWAAIAWGWQQSGGPDRFGIAHLALDGVPARRPFVRVVGFFRRFSSRFRPASIRPKSPIGAASRALGPAPSLCRASLAQRRRGGMASHVVRDRRMCRPSACAALRAAARWAHGVAREVGVGCVFALARSCFAGRARVLMDVGTRWPSVGLSAGSRPAVLRRPRDARDGSYSSRPVAGLPLCAVCFERPATAKDGITHVFEDSRRVSQAGYNGNRACGSRMKVKRTAFTFRPALIGCH